ncbi:MAG: fructose bisphosphate aldolase [Erysipelothrix sp.]|nr:fructose bisphosphate aldolase [Erysipelothrix sp.]
MSKEKLELMKHGKGFIAALDQSGGSTPKTLALYGVTPDMYADEKAMFEKIHGMRTRIINAPSFNSDRILGAILFENTMNSNIDGIPTSDYLWDKLHIVSFLKVDKGLDPLKDGVQLMKDDPNLPTLLDTAVQKGIFGTKMRSVIKEYNRAGIEKIVDQQFEVADIILSKGLIPIVEPEVDIHAEDKAKIETYLHQLIHRKLDALGPLKVILKLTPPEEDNLYYDFVTHQNIVRVAFLSGGYPQALANEKLSKNKGVIASFSRALSDGLNVNQDDAAFNETIKASIDAIYDASIK